MPQAGWRGEDKYKKTDTQIQRQRQCQINKYTLADNNFQCLALKEKFGVQRKIWNKLCFGRGPIWHREGYYVQNKFYAWSHVEIFLSISIIMVQFYHELSLGRTFSRISSLS